MNLQTIVNPMTFGDDIRNNGLSGS